MEPMIIDIILVQKQQPSVTNTSTVALGNECTTSGLIETVIERWVVQHEYSRTSTTTESSSSSSVCFKKTYKKCIILLRSLYTMMRLLPAFRAYRKLCIPTKACGFDINYKVSSFSVPFTRAEERLMKHYSFIPVEARHGRLSVSVKYRENLADFNLQTSTSFPPEIITDYVGSPATDPFRAFPMMIPPPPTTSCSAAAAAAPLERRPHTWTGGGTPFLLHYPQSSSGSHSRSSNGGGRYELSSSPTAAATGEVFGQATQRGGPPTTHHNNNNSSFEDYQLSPPFSPSPPTYLSGGNYMQSRLRSEATAPMSIPIPNPNPNPNSMMMNTKSSPRYISPNLSDPNNNNNNNNRHSLPPPSPRSTRYEHESPSGIRSLKKSDMSRVGDLSSGSFSASHHCNQYSSYNNKMSMDNKDDSGRFSGLLSSSGSPRIGLSSRSSSRLSLQDELDDIDFSCPFIVDDVESCDSPLSRSVGGKHGGELLSSHGKKLQEEAAVGALVRMLRTAPPLRQDSSSSCYSLRGGGGGGGPQVEFNTTTASASASGLFISSSSSRKTSEDALEELNTYRDIKHLILSKSGTPLVNRGDHL
ncbi:autophagy-related protein 13a isoform X2 [Rutidosis leptorrhynchoides]